MQEFFKIAVDNVSHLGDTDVFPFPIENHVFFDNPDRVIQLLIDVHKSFNDFRARMPPTKEDALALVGYTGFREATIIDPVWNLYLLGLTISIAERIESERRSLPDDIVFSYRFAAADTGHLLFRDDGWRRYRERSLELAAEHSHVLVTDIADFYPRIYHHRLENALGHLGLPVDTPARIMNLLSDFSNNASYGLPVGGPAARLLSELVLHGPDRLMSSDGIRFCRYADDYHIFTDSEEESYATLVRLSQILRIEGLSLQKAKTRILGSSEFIKSSLLDLGLEDEAFEVEAHGSQSHAQRASFLRLSLRYDPYSPTAEEDYGRLRDEVKRFDIVGMLAAELQKSHINVSLSKRLVRAIRFLDQSVRDDAALSVASNLNVLAPLFPSVLIALKDLYPALQEGTRSTICRTVRELVEQESYLTQIELNLAYALRLLSLESLPENEQLCTRLYRESHDIFVKRDIILMMARWKLWPWVSQLKGQFQNLRGPERRAFIIASYVLGDEGHHWRQHTKDEFNEFESIVRDWAAVKSKISDWQIPL